MTNNIIDFSLENIQNIKYENFYRKNVCRTWEKFRTPVLSRADDYFLPKASAIHYIPESSHEYGIDLSHSLMRNVGDRALVYHILKMDIIAGTTRHVSVNPETMMKMYHKSYRDLIRVRNIDKSNINDRLHMVVNYALLPHLYVQVHNNLAIWQEWKNIRNCMWQTIKDLGTERYHFITFKVPKFLPGKNEFIKFNTEMTVTGLKHFHTNENFDLLELWKILNDVSHGGNPPLSDALLEKTNLVFVESGMIITIRFLDLINWAKEKPSEIMRTFYSFMDNLLSLRTLASTGEIVKAITTIPDSEKQTEGEEEAPLEMEITGDETILHKDKSEHDIEKELLEQASIIDELIDENEEVAVNSEIYEIEENKLSVIEEKINERAAAGALSGAEQRGLIKLAERYKTIKNPFNPTETLADIEVTTEDLKIEHIEIAKNVISIHDKSLLKSRLQDFAKGYIQKVHDKDMLNMCLSIQNSGIIVKDISVTEKNTAVTKAKTFHIQVQPIAGKASTLKFTIPTLEEDGSFTASSVKYKLDIQRGDLPLAKVKPYTVALTSYYGKSFIIRNQNAATNYSRWIKNKIVKASNDPLDESITSVTHGINKFNGIHLPRAYTAIGEELTQFTTLTYNFFWNYNKLNSFFTEKEIQLCKARHLIPCGREISTSTVIVAMDNDGIVYEVRDTQITPIGTLPSVLNEGWGEGPMEYAEIGIFNRRIPIILALLYKYGLDATFKSLNIKYSRIPPTARYSATPQTYRLKFKDESFIIDIKNPATKLLIAGFNAVRKNISDYSSHELNKRSSFNYLLSGSGITQHHLRELLLMYDMYIDPITLGLLKEMKEPTTFKGLLLRANEMLIDDWIPKEDVHRFKGYERFAGMAYNQIITSIRGYRARGNIPDAEITMNPSAVWLDIVQDQSITLVEDSNPIHNLKEKEAVTFAGAGGRSALTMVKETRGFKEGELGVISEATPDSDKVGIRTFMVADPNLINLRGVSRPFNEKKDGAASLVSTSALLAPAVTQDDENIFQNIPSRYTVMYRWNTL